MPDYHIPLFPDNYYHIVSRAVGDEKLFREQKNYQFLLQRYQKYISPVSNTFAYCLLPNHFHFLVRIKTMDDIRQHFELMKPRRSFSTESSPDFIMERFSNFLNSYTKAFNAMYNRKGALFIDYLRRVEVKTENQFQATLFYIHKNPVHHQYVEKVHLWNWSSFNSILSSGKTMLLRDEVLDWFDSRENFLQYHHQPVYPKETAILE